ncbi:MAG: tRNA (adenosine(37)-N6)-threonylcarbamoyltransferase complex dimerization subunit type 1 TsaB [Pseudomonadota bacterium]
MNILAVDTATEICSVAVASGDTVVARSQETARDHSRLILPMLEKLLAEAGISKSEIDGIAFGHGPGSFTGVRIGVGVAHGLALALDCPVVGVSNLAAIAQRCLRENTEPNVLVAIDARMNEVYWGAFCSDENGLMRAGLVEQVTAPEAVKCPKSDNTEWIGAGTGWVTYKDALSLATANLNVRGSMHQLPLAQDILTLAKDDFESGRAMAPELAQPVYLRNKVAQTVSERQNT